MSDTSTGTLDLARTNDDDPGIVLPAADRPLTTAQQDQVAQAVRTVNAILLRKNLEIAIELHRYVLAEFFAGDWAAWAENRPGVSPAYDAFVGNSALRVGKEMLRELIRVGEQVRQLPGAVGTELTVAQHRALLPVPDPSERAQLAERALRDGLAADKLAELVRELHPPKQRGKGRPAQLRGFKRLAEVHKAGKGLDAQVVAAEVAKYTPHQREQVMARARAMKELAEALLAVVAEVG